MMKVFRFFPIMLLTVVLASPDFTANDPAAAFRARIEKLISDHNYHATSNPHYVIKTDDPRLDIDAVASLLESFHSYFESFWSERASMHETDGPSRIYLFYSRYKYKQLLENTASEDLIEFVGHYTAHLDIVALHTDTVGLENLADLLLHEAAHQLVQVRLYGKDTVPSPWISEGLASYFGNTLRDRSGEFKTGEIGGKGATFFKGVSPTSRGSASHDLREYRRALKKGEATPLKWILSADSDSFYLKEGAAERYTASWLLVHFLLHADGGARAPSLVRYLEHEAEGKGGLEVFQEDIGMTPDQLQVSLTSYVASLKAR